VAFHTWSLSLHAAASALVVLLALRLGIGSGGALLAGLIFASHPIHTEAVGWISAHSELMAGALLLGAWVAHLAGRWLVASALLGLALLSKEVAVVFPGLVLAGDLLAGAGSAQIQGRPAGRRRVLGPIAAYVAMVAGYLILRAIVLGHVFGGGGQAFGRELLNPLIGQPLITRLLTVPKVIGVALAQAFFPKSLCIDYGYNQLPIVTSPIDPRLWLALAPWGLLALLAWLIPSQRRWLGLGAAVFLVSFLPASNALVPGISILAERNLYLPLLGVCLMAGGAIGSRSWPRPLAVAAGAVLVAGLSARTLARNVEFTDTIRFYTAGTKACPAAAGAHQWLGSVLREAERLPESAAALRVALEIAPNYADARAELGLTLALMGQRASAEKELVEALRLRPGDILARSNLALLYADTGRTDQALEQYEILERDGADDPDVRANHGSVLIQAGRIQQARAIFESVARSHPGSAAGPNGLGALAAQEQDWSSAATHFSEAHRRDPRDRNALYNAALALHQTGRAPEALAALEKGVAAGVTDQEIQRLLNTLRGPGRRPARP